MEAYFFSLTLIYLPLWCLFCNCLTRTQVLWFQLGLFSCFETCCLYFKALDRSSWYYLGVRLTLTLISFCRWFLPRGAGLTVSEGLIRASYWQLIVFVWPKIVIIENLNHCLLWSAFIMDGNIKLVVGTIFFLKLWFLPPFMVAWGIERGAVLVAFGHTFHVCMDLIHYWVV